MKKDTGLSFDASGALKLTNKQRASPCDVSTDMLVRYSLVRRGLALEQANVMSYEKHDLLVEKLFQCRLQDPPPGFARVSRSGIKMSAGGRPCDVAFQSCLTSSEFLSILQHKPLAVGGDETAEPPLKRLRRDPDKGKGGKGQGKAQLHGKGDGAGRVPAELLALGCVSRMPKNHRLCYDYSLKKCTLHVQSQRCAKGLHLCAVKGCHKAHAALDCNLANARASMSDYRPA